MLWPVCLLVPTQFFYHVHQCLVSSFHLFIGLSMVRQSSNLPYCCQLTQLSDDVAFKVGSSITQEPGQGSKDWDVTLLQKLSKSFCSLVQGHIHHNMLHKVITKTNTFTTFGRWFNSIIVSILVKSMCSNSNGAVSMVGHIGALAWVSSCWMQCSQLLIAFCIWAAIPGHQNWSCSKHNVHFWPWCPASQWHSFMGATWWALGTTNHRTSSTHQQGCGDVTGLPGRGLASSALGV